MRITLRTLLLGLLLAVHLAAVAADVSRFVGSWRVVRDGTTVHIRIEPNGGVDFISPKDGSSMRGKALLGGANGQTAFGGVLANGQTFAIGLVRGAPMLSLGEAMLPMQAMTAQPPASATAQAAAPSDSSLAGLRLSTAKGRNGYFTERSYDFCADGRVFTRWAESQMSQFGSGVSERTDHGTWHLSGNSLQLSLARGGVTTFSVQQPEPRVVRLDATSYAVERSARCR
jgi:hypothetical protein